MVVAAFVVGPSFEPYLFSALPIPIVESPVGVPGRLGHGGAKDRATTHTHNPHSHKLILVLL